jgi:hypothetical protein
LVILGVAVPLASPTRPDAIETQTAAAQLAGTAALDWPEEDLSGRLMDGAHRFVERQIATMQARTDRFWKYDRSSAAAWNAALSGNRDRLREIIGAVDQRVAPALERFGDDENPAIVAETPRYRVVQVRWPVLDGMTAEGLLVDQISGTPAASLVAVPDAGQTPEQILGLAPGLPAERQFARVLAESGCELVIPTLRSSGRASRPGGNGSIGRPFTWAGTRSASKSRKCSRPSIASAHAAAIPRSSASSVLPKAA